VEFFVRYFSYFRGMKKFIQKYVIWLTLILLSVLLFIQVKWMVYSIQFQEKVFKNSVDLALNKTIANLNNDKMVCNAMRECMGCDTVKNDSQLLTRGIWDQIHTSIDNELSMFNIDLDYDLFITKDKQDTIRNGPINLVVKSGTCYTQSLRELLQTSGYELVVVFPGRSRFLFQEAGLMLVSSVILILLIIFFFMKVVTLYRNEQRLSENIRELINNITHEFKTPISSIALASNLIRKGKPDGDKMQEYGNLIFLENQKLHNQVESLLDLAALEREEFEYHKKPESLNELVNNALHSIKLPVEEKNGKIEIHLTEGDDTVFADRTHLTNAITNLLTNALKYSAEPPEIGIRTYSGENHLFLEISDKGIGIHSKYQKHIFEKYYRVPTGDVHNIKGFGIGLSYVKSVITAHQGKVLVSSEPGNGSTFTVILLQSV
jgi:two-component system, OmpR family, phosphate regulon sensor histidine kinase PhoR